MALRGQGTALRQKNADDVRRPMQAGDVKDHRPLYARMLRLRHISPSGVLCFVFLEGACSLGILLALAELVSWWGVLVLPATVAVMVKLNDVIAGLLGHSPAPVGRTTARAAVLRPADRPEPCPAVDVDAAGQATTRLPGLLDSGERVKRPWAERLEAHHQWSRQSATRRYE